MCGEGREIKRETKKKTKNKKQKKYFNGMKEKKNYWDRYGMFFFLDELIWDGIWK